MNKLVVSSLMLSFVVIGACKKKEEAPNLGSAIESIGADVKKSAEEGTEAVKAAGEEVAAKVSEAGEELDKQIAELEEKAKEATGEVKAELEKQVEALKAQKAATPQ